MMTAEMARMASSMTQQARQDGAEKIERWRKAVEVVRQAEERAETLVSLPTSLTAAANRAGTTIQSADYVSAVGLANTAVRSRMDVFASASRALESEIQTRSAILLAAKRVIENEDRTLQASLSRVENAKNQSLSSVSSRVATAKKKKTVEVWGNWQNLAFGGFIVNFFWGLVILALAIVLSPIYMFVWLLSWSVNATSVAMATSQYSKSHEAAQVVHQQEAEKLKTETRNKKGTLQNAVVDAASSLKNAEDSLMFLQAYIKKNN